MSGFLSSYGGKRETTYGTEVVPDRFWEFDSEGLKPDIGRLESNANRAGSYGPLLTHWIPLVRGGGGAVPLPVMTKGWGWHLEPMLGTVATGTANADGRRDHVGTLGSLVGKSATVQVNKVFEDGSASPFTGKGGKITQWALSCDLHERLMFEPTWDFQKLTTTTALASPSYPTGAELMTFIGGSLLIGGDSIDVKGAVAVTGNNGLKTDDHRGTSLLKREPKANERPSLTWSATLFWESMAQYNRVISDTRDGALAAVVFTFRGPSVIAGTSYPELVISIPNARFDGDTPTVGGAGLLELAVNGIGMNTPGANDMVTVTYKSADATP